MLIVDDNIKIRKKFLTFGQPLIEQEEIDELLDCLKSSWLGTGPKVNRFENDFSNYIGIDYAAAVNSCTAALHLSLLACDLKPGDEVITTPMTFCATINAIIHAGAKPVLADIDPLTFNIDPKQIVKKLTSKTRAIVPVHFAGRICDMSVIMTFAKDHDLKVIEDCAHAVESDLNGQKAGTFGDFGCFSFYSTKNVVTGEGGMVVTSNEEAISRIKCLALHGMNKDAWKRFGDDGFKHYQVTECGFKYNMMDMQAALGIHQLARVEKNWERRRMIWDTYMQAFSDLPITLPAPVPANEKHAYHLFTILIDEEQCGISRDEFLNRMHGYNIGTGVHYMSISEHPYYQDSFGWRPEDYPESMRVGRQTVSLPLSPKLSDADVEDVVNAVVSVLNQGLI